MASDDVRLSQIATQWTLLFRAHHAASDERGRAQAQLLQRYCAPVYRYVLALTRDPSTAEELCQEFALRLVRGDFWRVDPTRGRFRDYLKTSLIHLASEHGRRNRPSVSVAVSPELVSLSPAEEADRLFLNVWRTDLLNRTWAALEKSDHEGDRRGYDILRFKCDDPTRTSQSIAEELSRQVGVALTAAGVRQTLHRAREQFAELLRSEVAASIPSTDPEVIDAELAELGLLAYLPPKSRAD